MNIYQNIKSLNQPHFLKKITFRSEKIPYFSQVIERILPQYSALFFNIYSRPIMIICETVNICCNDCIICPYSKMTRKKEIMSLRLFEKVLQDYSAIGGGKFSLTPKCGDIFFDTFLLDRLDLIKKYPKISGLSVTTNAILSDKLDDIHLRKVVNSFERMHISIYGIDSEEYSIMTQRDTYERMITNIQRIISLSEKDNIVFGFRFLKQHTESEIEEWIINNFKKRIPYGETNIYMDWGGAIDSAKPLPFKGLFHQRKEGLSQCLIPLSACLIYSNGDVGYCSCNDYDIKDEFLLGNISKASLKEILNSQKNQYLWANLPDFCKTCVSYRPCSEVSTYEFMFEDPIHFIGG